MRAVLERVPAIASPIISRATTRPISLLFTKQSTAPWICDRCLHSTQHKFLSPPGKRSQSLSKRPIIPSLRPLSPPTRTLTSYPRLRNDDPTPRSDLPSQEESRRSHASKRFDHLMDTLQSNIFIANQRLNDLTGYSGIEALKKDIEQQELQAQQTRHHLHRARESYSEAITLRATSQREVNALLQRKHAWTPADLERFTALYRSDHANELAEKAAQEALTAIETEAEEAAARLSKSILARYHEEQIWSDKIRRMSTWGTWGLMGVNVLLFLVFQIGVEPWRRGRLVRGFEEKVVEALEKGGKGRVGEGKEMGVEGVDGQGTMTAVARDGPALDVSLAAKGEAAEGSVVMEMPVEPTPADRSPTPWWSTEPIKERIRDLFSERQISLRQVDLTTVAFEGAAAGVAFVGLVVLLLRPR